MKKNGLIVLLITLISVFFVLPIFLYFISFHGGLSSVSNDWGNYGSLLSGTIASLLSFINILLLTFTLREENKNRKESKVQEYTQILGNQFNTYLQLIKTSITEEVFRTDFKHMYLDFDKVQNIDTVINDFVFNKSGTKYFLIENILIILDKIKHLNEEQFNFYNNCLSIEFDDQITKYLIVAINSTQYKNNLLMKKFLFWYISIKPDVLISKYKSSKRELLEMSITDGEYPYIEWK